MKTDALELYRQRYETWRHLDKVRYQTIQLAIGLSGAVAVVLKATGGDTPSWFWLVLALISGFLWQVLRKINSAIRLNGDALKKFGSAVGDDLIPSVAGKDRSVFFYVEGSFGIFTIFFLLIFFFSLAS